MGFGYNTTAALITRGCSEMRRLAMAMGGRPETLGTWRSAARAMRLRRRRCSSALFVERLRDTRAAGLSGIGDLMLTAFGSLSRNRQVGVRLGKGEKVEDILASMGEVAEGVRAPPPRPAARPPDTG